MSLKSNVVANYLGTGWRAIMSLAFVPVYIRYLGVEAYALIGIFVMLQAWLRLLDMGMKPALAREMARFTGGGHDAQSVWTLLRTVEIVALGMAGLIALVVWLASGWLANGWVQPEQISPDAVARAFALMGAVVAIRFIESIYVSSIAGLQRQVLENAVASAMATLRGLGAVGFLIWISPTIEAYFIWQGVISLITVFVFGFIIYRLLPRPPRPATFSISALFGIWRFAAGMMGITILSLLLTQIDKILLSRLLTLEAFGYYALAAVVAGGLYMMTSPIAAAFYPRFIQLVTRGDNSALTDVYHLGAQLVAVLMGSAALILIFFADRVLLLWTADSELTRNSASLLRVLAMGTFLNGLMLVPYQMQLAHAWTSLTVRINLVAVAILAPSIFWIVPKFGALGAAWVWVMLNIGYLWFDIYFMHRRVLRDEKWRWYWEDTTFPLGAGIATVAILAWVLPIQSSRIVELAVLVVCSLAALAATSMSAPMVRQRALKMLHRS